MKADPGEYVKIDDIVNSGDITKMLGITYPQLSNWKSRYGNFPAPFKILGKEMALYRRSEVLKWYINHFPERAAAMAALFEIINQENT